MYGYICIIHVSKSHSACACVSTSCWSINTHLFTITIYKGSWRRHFEGRKKNTRDSSLADDHCFVRRGWGSPHDACGDISESRNCYKCSYSGPWPPCRLTTPGVVRAHFRSDPSKLYSCTLCATHEANFQKKSQSTSPRLLTYTPKFV